MSELTQISKKIVLLGDQGVGKTSMIKKYVYDIFDDKYISTLGTKVTTKSVKIEDKTKDRTVEIKLLIWDMMGQKEYEMFHHSAYTGSQGALIVCDITRKETLENLPDWITGLFNATNQIPIVVIGNKNDLEDQKQFGLDEMTTIANTFDVPLYLTSAKTGENIEIAFMKLCEKILE
jgi:small GTP-binding protein